MKNSLLYAILLALTISFNFIPRVDVIYKYNPFDYISYYRLSFYAFIKSMLEDYINLVGVSEENQELKKELAYYKTFKNDIAKCQNEARQVYYISNTLSFINQSSNPYIYISKIIGYDLSGGKSILEIKNNAHIKDGDIVSSNGYFLGVVYKSTSGMAYVMSVYNKHFNTIVYDYRTGDTYIYKGGYPLGDIINANSNDDIKVGDLIYFRSLKNQEVPYLLLGKIESITPTKNLFFYKVKVRPYANPNIYDFVVVIGNVE